MRKSQVHHVLSHLRRGQAGVSMIEFLVALIIFAFGTLGLAGLQTQALAYSQGSLYRSQATTLTDDILDRMRTDRANAKAGAWDTVLTADYSTFTGTSIADSDRYEWKQQVKDLLPSGQASIAYDGVTKIVTITIQWDDSRGNRATTTSNQQFVTKTQL
jgi:type IV pilus assembly protein PilV